MHKLPAGFLPHRNCDSVSQSLILLRKKYCTVHAEKNKTVTLISSMHNTNTIDGNSEKSEIVKFYNINKSSVVSLDQIYANYPLSCCCQYWPLAIFSPMLYLAGIYTGEIFTIMRSQ